MPELFVSHCAGVAVESTVKIDPATMNVVIDEEVEDCSLDELASQYLPGSIFPQNRFQYYFNLVCKPRSLCSISFSCFLTMI